MDVRQETRVGHLILTPDDSLMCGGRAEQFERLLQEVIAAGQRHLIVDLGAVAHADSGGVRALVRGHLTGTAAGWSPGTGEYSRQRAAGASPVEAGHRVSHL